MTRKTALALARIAGYHDDPKAFTRLVIESRVAMAALNSAWVTGQLARTNGVPCACQECRKAQNG